MADLALVARNLAADQRHQPGGDLFAPPRRRGLDKRATERRLRFVGRQPIGRLLDDAQRRLVTGLRRLAPGEQPVAAEHHPDIVGIGRRHFAELQPEVEAWPLPRQEAQRAAEHCARQRLGVGAGGDGDHRVGVNVIDVEMRHEGVQGRVDRGGARVEIEGAMVEQGDHFVFVGEPAIAAFQAFQLVEIEGCKAVALHRAEIAAGALDPQHRDRLAGQRIVHFDLGRGVAAAEIGDAQVAAEQIGAIEQPARLIEARRTGVVPQVGERLGRGPGHRRHPPSRRAFARTYCYNRSWSIAG